MHATHNRWLRRLFRRSIAGFVAFLLLVFCGIEIAHAAEIIPSVGIVQPRDDNADAQVFGGLAVRGQILPVLMSEIGVGYRTESRFNDALKVTMWPVTGSLWLTPVPALYAGGGVGWYHTTLNYNEDVLPVAPRDETRQEFGIHVGGGLRVPLGTAAGLDLGGRYVMMRDQDSQLVPNRFDPDFWMTSVGLAFKF